MYTLPHGLSHITRVRICTFISGIRQSLFTDCYSDEQCITSRHLLGMLLRYTKGKLLKMLQVWAIRSTTCGSWRGMSTRNQCKWNPGDLDRAPTVPAMLLPLYHSGPLARHIRFTPFFYNFSRILVDHNFWKNLIEKLVGWNYILPSCRQSWCRKWYYLPSSCASILLV